MSNGTNPDTWDEKQAVKFDGEKPMLSLIPTHAMLGMGRALTYGAKKYNNYNYKQGEGLDWDRYSSALLRHLFAWLGGEDKDRESGLNHLDHMLACAAMLSDAVYSGIGKDTRFNQPEPLGEISGVFLPAEALKLHPFEMTSTGKRIVSTADKHAARQAEEILKELNKKKWVDPLGEGY